MVYDVIIIGAGIMGSATAFQLTEIGKKCLLIDKFSLGHSYGSSHGDSRIIRRSYPEKHFATLMRESYELWNQLESNYNEQFIVSTGGLDFGDNNSSDMKKVVDTVKHLDLPHELLSSQEITQKFPAFKLPDNYYGLYQPDAGIVLASKSVKFFQNNAQKKGLEILTGEKVSLLKEENDYILVSTKSKSFKAKKVIVCVGSWINEFFKNYRISHRTKILPVNFGYWKVQQPDHFKVGSFPIFIAWSDKTFYGFPSLERAGYFKMGAHYSYHEKEFRSTDLSKQLDETIIRDMVSFIDKTFPFANANDYDMDACYYTMNTDENFILDFHPDNSNIVIGGGFSGHGFKFAPLIGKILSDLAIENQTQYDLSKFQFKSF